jgi:hypothetical protein
MKVICKDNAFNSMFITLDKSYDVRHTTYRVDKFQLSITIGMGIDVDTFYYIICDDGSEKSFISTRFVEVSENRTNNKRYII